MKKTEKQLGDAMKNATGEQVLLAMEKAIRFRNAQKFIDTLDIKLDEKSLHKMLDFLIDFQIFIDKKD